MHLPPTEGGIGGIGGRNCLVCWLVRNQQPKKYRRHRSHLKTLFFCLVALSFGFSVFCFNSNIPIQPPRGCTMDRPTLHDQTVHSTSCSDVFVAHAQGLTVMLLECARRGQLSDKKKAPFHWSGCLVGYCIHFNQPGIGSLSLQAIFPLLFACCSCS